MPDQILITGATGNIGSEIVRQLKEKGVDFVVGSSSGPVEGVESVAIDFSDKSSLVKAMQHTKTLFMVLPSHPDMVKMGENIIDAAKECGVSHVVRSSGSLANFNSPIMIEKLLGTTDEYLKSSGLDYTITTPSFFMQNFITTFKDDYCNGAIYQPVGDQKIGWVDVRDIAAVNVEALLNPVKYLGRTLTITGSEKFSYAEVVQQMNQILGKETQFVSVPEEAALEGMKGMGFPEFIIDLLLSLSLSTREGHGDEVTNIVSEVLGRQPITFKQFVEDNKSVWL